MIRAIVFDFDGVIANSEPLHFRAYRDVLVERGITLTESAYYELYPGYDDVGRSTRLQRIAAGRSAKATSPSLSRARRSGSKSSRSQARCSSGASRRPSRAWQMHGRWPSRQAR